MGLDICVRKITKEPNNREDYFRLIDDNGDYDRSGFPKWTLPFENERVEIWYDWQKFKEQTGIDIDKCNCHGISYTENGSFMEVSPIDKEVPEWDDKKYKDWNEYESERGKVVIKIDLDKVPKYEKTIKVLYFEEIGCQRKGLNVKFYADYRAGKIGYFVWTKAELEKYKEEYCDEPYDCEYPNGEKSGQIIYPKSNFQKNIIDTFTEGEDCVIFDW